MLSSSSGEQPNEYILPTISFYTHRVLLLSYITPATSLTPFYCVCFMSCNENSILCIKLCNCVFFGTSSNFKFSKRVKRGMKNATAQKIISSINNDSTNLVDNIVWCVIFLPVQKIYLLSLPLRNDFNRFPMRIVVILCTCASAENGHYMYKFPHGTAKIN